MTQRIEQMLRSLRAKEHRAVRRDVSFPPAEEMAQLTPAQRVTVRLCQVLEAELPIVRPQERIAFQRTVKQLPPLFTETEWQDISQSHYTHEQWRVCNISPDYERVIRNGLLYERRHCEERSKTADEQQKAFLLGVIQSIDAVLALVERYRKEAERVGNSFVADLLSRVPAQGAKTYAEALQSMRILHFTLWEEGEYQNTLGRFDQYMYPYVQADLNAGRLTEEEVLELTEEFFLCLNKDNDLYPGMQQGDNGQSMMLGGVDREGNDAYNRLSELCLEASKELKLIDPKINMRVSSKTPMRLFELGTKLTKEGLGFPQYSNDDIVIPSLVEKGYDLEDARDYTVAACWEFIIPKLGMEIPNIGAVNFPKLINDCILEELDDTCSWEEFFERVKRRLKEECAAINRNIKNLYIIPAPFMSLMMDGCIDRAKDISLGNKYNNFGFHGVGVSTAVDSLAALRHCCFEEHSLSVEDAKDIVKNGFDGKDALFAKLRYEEPKFGNNDDTVDQIAVDLLDAFGESVKGLKNERGGIIRAGTGSAMYYLWYADNVSTSLSGHRKGEALSANYSPELFVRNRGPLSVMQSFTKPNLGKVCNGGPLTMEFHSTVFRGEEGIHKVALLVKSFVDAGGHQLQLNSVNHETLLDAQAHPENYQNLIVRVWGWSAYFVELDKEYQDHVIARQEFVI